VSWILLIIVIFHITNSTHSIKAVTPAVTCIRLCCTQIQLCTWPRHIEAPYAVAHMWKHWCSCASTLQAHDPSSTEPHVSITNLNTPLTAAAGCRCATGATQRQPGHNSGSGQLCTTTGSSTNPSSVPCSDSLQGINACAAAMASHPPFGSQMTC
jgi:hypothetical protein